MLYELIIVFALIIANGLFSMAEIAIVSVRKSKLESLIKKGDKRAKIALNLSNDHTRFLSTVQVGITLIGVFTGAYGAHALVDDVQPHFVWTEVYISGSSHAISFFITLVGITYLSIVWGELLPKKFGLTIPEKVAPIMAPIMQVVSHIFSPFVWLLSVSTELLVKLFKLKPQDEPGATEEEIKSLITQGTNTGEFEEVEQDIIENVFHLGDRQVASLMTPRIDTEWVDIREDFDTIKQSIISSPHNWFPVCDEDLDNTLGILPTKKFLIALQNSASPIDIISLCDKPLFVTENMNAFRVLEEFRIHNKRIAMVVDEYGSVQGLVTINDLVDALVGEISQPAGTEEETIVQREDGSYLVDALLPFEEFLQYFELDDASISEKGGFHTMAGLILHLKGQLPKVGEVFNWRNFTLEVIDMDGNRVDKILVRQVVEVGTQAED